MRPVWVARSFEGLGQSDAGIVPRVQAAPVAGPPLETLLPLPLDLVEVGFLESIQGSRTGTPGPLRGRAIDINTTTRNAKPAWPPGIPAGERIVVQGNDGFVEDGQTVLPSTEQEINSVGAGKRDILITMSERIVLRPRPHQKRRARD